MRSGLFCPMFCSECVVVLAASVWLVVRASESERPASWVSVGTLWSHPISVLWWAGPKAAGEGRGGTRGRRRVREGGRREEKMRRGLDDVSDALVTFLPMEHCSGLVLTSAAPSLPTSLTLALSLSLFPSPVQIGRASCRERV